MWAQTVASVLTNLLFLSNFQRTTQWKLEDNVFISLETTVKKIYSLTVNF